MYLIQKGHIITVCWFRLLILIFSHIPWTLIHIFKWVLIVLRKISNCSVITRRLTFKRKLLLPCDILLLLLLLLLLFFSINCILFGGMCSTWRDVVSDNCWKCKCITSFKLQIKSDIASIAIASLLHHYIAIIFQIKIQYVSWSKHSQSEWVR